MAKAKGTFPFKQVDKIFLVKRAGKVVSTPPRVMAGLGSQEIMRSGSEDCQLSCAAPPMRAQSQQDSMVLTNGQTVLGLSNQADLLT